MTERLVDAALRFVPPDWRANVAEDLQDAAAADGHGPVWVAWHAACSGMRIRIARFSDGARFDLQCAVRSLTRSPWFTCGALLTCALGIGVNIAVFTAVDRMLFRQLPYERPDDIVVLREIYDDGPVGTVSAAIVAAARQHHRGFADLSLAGFSSGFSTSRDGDDGAPLRLTEASHNTLELFGVQVIRGRDFIEQDETVERRVVLISYDAWRARFGAADDVVGRQIWADGAAVEIVGVLPERFIPASNFLDPRSDGFVLMDARGVTRAGERLPPPYVRLRTGVSVEAAQAELDVVAESVRRELPRSPNARPTRWQLVPLRSVLFDRYTSLLWLVAIAAALVLAIACANLGSLMLVRNRSREHLAATQVALGASAWRLMRAGIIESGLLALLGTCVALLMLYWTDAALRSVLPAVFSRYTAAVTEFRVLIFALLTALTCTMAAGVYPSWRMTRVDVLTVLQRGSASARSGRVRGSRSLLAVEAALSVMLVAGATMTGRSLVTLSRTNLGFEPADLYSIDVAWPRSMDAAARFQQVAQVVGALKLVAGATASGAADISPLSNARAMRPLGPDMPGTTGRWQVTDAFFATMGMRVLAGRVFAPEEVASDGSVAVLSESGLRAVWPGVSPAAAVGRTLQFAGEQAWLVVGIVSDVRATYAASTTPSLYLPLSGREFRLAQFAVRMTPGTSPQPAVLRVRLREAGVTITNVSVRGVEADLRRSLGDQRFRAVLFSVFGVIALALAAVGLYAVGAYEAAQRQREVGIRLAIGSSARDVQWLIIRQALAPVVVGLATGLAATYWAAKFMQAFLHQIDARDPATFVFVVVVLTCCAVTAAWLPARRAARLDPFAVLRVQ